MRVSAARAPRRRSAASSSKYAGILVSSTCYLIPEPRSGDTCYHSPIVHTSYFIFQKHSFLSSAFFNQKKMEYIKIGYIRKPHGTKGELKVVVEDKFVDDFIDADVVFIDMTGTKAPYFVESIRDAGFLLLTLEDFDSRSAVELLSKKSLYLRRTDISLSDAEIAADDNQLVYAYLQGYTLYDTTTERWVGEIAAVLQYPQQEMAEIRSGDKKILIPIQATWIVETDKALKKIKMQLPMGILDL
jgi:16S rRNA processing protein RimM